MRQVKLGACIEETRELKTAIKDDSMKNLPKGESQGRIAENYVILEALILLVTTPHLGYTVTVQTIFKINSRYYGPLKYVISH